ncbi:MAG: hypothetical protein JWM74_2400, partial [Myxococcaceae bacterium]|nr:hypothetical protein [Myxococcaceae bacterium]
MSEGSVTQHGPLGEWNGHSSAPPPP